MVISENHNLKATMSAMMCHLEPNESFTGSRGGKPINGKKSFEEGIEQFQTEKPEKMDPVDGKKERYKNIMHKILQKNKCADIFRNAII